MRRLLLMFAVTCALPAAAEAQSVAYGLVGSDHIVTFNPSSPGTITSNLPITGLGSGETLTGIDIRPADGLIYTVATDGNVYRLTNTGSSYAATNIGVVQQFPPTTPPTTIIPVTGSNFGFDFAGFDRIRLIGDTDQELRINPLNGGAGADPLVNDGAGGHPYDIIGVAYSDSAPGFQQSTIYAIDGITASLLRGLPGISGTYLTTNLSGDPFDPLGIALTSQSDVGFDILFAGGVNSAFLTANDNFYSVDLTTGQASLIGGLGIGNIRGLTLAAVPEPGTWATMIFGFGAAGLALRRSRKPARVSARV